MAIDASVLAGETKDNWQHVMIGTIELGIKNYDDPDTSRPNPSLIEWWQEFDVSIKKITGEKPVTILISPKTIWHCTMEFNALDNKPLVLQPLLDMDAGPRRVTDFDHNNVCMLLKKKKFVQRKGTKDWYRALVLEFVENNPGVY